MLTNFKEMWIPCSEQEYPEVKQLLDGMGCKLVGWKRFDTQAGIVTYTDGTYQLASNPYEYHPTVTLDELRAMAKPNDESTDDLRLLKERVGIMERSIMGMESKINEIHKLLFEE